MKLRLSLLALVLLACTSAFAWPSCNGTWVQVPTGTTGGTIYKTGDGITFQCQQKPAQPPTTGPTNISNNSNSTSSASSGSTSNSNSSATGGNASATGGNASQKQSQSQSSSNSATNNGNNSTYSSTTNVEADKIPVNTALAPPVFSTASCFKGFGGAVQTMPVGASFGAGKIDKNCQILVTAAQAPSTLARCKVYITSEPAKKAGVTLADCLAVEKPAPVVPLISAPPVPQIIVPTPAVTVNVQPVLPAPPEYRTVVDVVAPKKNVCAAKPKAKVNKPCYTGEK